MVFLEGRRTSCCLPTKVKAMPWGTMVLGPMLPVPGINARTVLLLSRGPLAPHLLSSRRHFGASGLPPRCHGSPGEPASPLPAQTLYRQLELFAGVSLQVTRLSFAKVGKNRCRNLWEMRFTYTEGLKSFIFVCFCSCLFAFLLF